MDATLSCPLAVTVRIRPLPPHIRARQDRSAVMIIPGRRHSHEGISMKRRIFAAAVACAAAFGGLLAAAPAAQAAT